MKRFWIALFFTQTLFCDVITIEPPDFSNVIEYVAGIRPYRTSGIRLEPEYTQDKLIIHNYGHGGSGLSLSWGCAKIASEILDEHMPSARSVAIIGSGVIGLSLAHTLLDLGYEVSIYAAEFPPHTTSDIATGTFGTYLVEGKEAQAFQRIRDISYEKLTFLATTPSPEFAGVGYVNFYNANSKETRHENAKLVEVQFGTKDVQIAEMYPKLFMEAPLYMKELLEKAKSKGAKVLQKKFDHLEELTLLPEEVIFNCTGIGSRLLCQDQDLIPIRGQLVYVAATSQIPYVAYFGDLDDQTFCGITPRPCKNAYAIGGCLEKHETEKAVTPEMCEKLLKNMREAFLSDFDED